jgi:Uma2 family endonuclease
MQSQITRRAFTVDDCYRMAEAGILRPDERVELIRGDIVKMSPIGPRHAAAVDRANRAFVTCAGDQAIVRVQGTTVLDQFSAPQPDVLLLNPREDFYVKKHPGPADVLLVIEVADSSLEYDMEVKCALYAIMGIVEYWIADLRNNRVICHADPVPGKDSYSTVREFHRGDIVIPRSLSECSVLADLLLS